MVFVFVCFMCAVCFVKKLMEGRQLEILSDGRAKCHIFYRKHQKKNKKNVGRFFLRHRPFKD